MNIENIVNEAMFQGFLHESELNRFQQQRLDSASEHIAKEDTSTNLFPTKQQNVRILYFEYIIYGISRLIVWYCVALKTVIKNVTEDKLKNLFETIIRLQFGTWKLRF